MAARGKDTTMKTLFVATAAFAALVMIAPIGNAASVAEPECSGLCHALSDAIIRANGYDPATGLPLHHRRHSRRH
jgi:hypothetical protein